MDNNEEQRIIREKNEVEDYWIKREIECSKPFVPHYNNNNNFSVLNNDRYRSYLEDCKNIKHKQYKIPRIYVSNNNFQKQFNETQNERKIEENQ